MIQYYNPKCSPPWQPHELEIKVKNAYSYNRDVVGKYNPKIDFSKVIVDQNELRWDLDKNEKQLKTIRNIVNYFLIADNPLHKVIGFNEFTGSVEFLKRAPWHSNTDQIGAWTDNDTIQLEFHLNQRKAIQFNSQMLGRAVIVAAKYIRYHPVRDYLEQLKWDGVGRIDGWLIDYCEAEDKDLHRIFAAKFLLGAVARIYKPGIKYGNHRCPFAPQMCDRLISNRVYHAILSKSRDPLGSYEGHNQ